MSTNEEIRRQLGWGLVQQDQVLAGFEATNGKRPVKPERPATAPEREAITSVRSVDRRGDNEVPGLYTVGRRPN